MEQKTLSLVLKLVIVGLAAAGMIVYFAALPLLGKSLIASYPEYSRCYLPWLSFLWITAIPCFASLFPGWSLAAEVGRDNSFSMKNARSLRAIAFLAAADAVFFFAGNIVFLLLDLSHPSIFLFSCFIVFIGIAIAVASACLSHLVRKAAVLRDAGPAQNERNGAVRAGRHYHGQYFHLEKREGQSHPYGNAGQNLPRAGMSARRSSGMEGRR